MLYIEYVLAHVVSTCCCKLQACMLFVNSHMTHAGFCHIAVYLFVDTNVMTEELSNHELHDVEGDLLTISGGCGSAVVSNVFQYMLLQVASLHAVCAFLGFTSDETIRSYRCQGS